MNDKEFEILLLDIVTKCILLKDKFINIPNLPVDWICIFSQSQVEYENMLTLAAKWGHVVKETPTGPIYRFDRKLNTPAGIPNVLKIRTPDLTKPERGDVDFSTDYTSFKNTYLDNKRFTLIVRDEFEMIELKEAGASVICYFSSIPPSKLVS